VNAGNETKTEIWKGGSNFVAATKTYNSYGLVATSTDPDGNATGFIYDSTNLQPATTTNALSQATGYLYDLSSGKVKQVYDPNGRITQNLLDPLDRASTSTIPDSVTGATVTKATYSYTDNSSPPSSQKITNYLTTATSSDTYLYFDGLGRKIQERDEADGNNTFAVSDNVYNSQGLLLKASLPYFASSTAFSSATTTSTLFTTYTYDVLRRPSIVGNAVGTTTNSYDIWSLSVVDPLGHQKIYAKDAYGNLANVGEYTSTSSATTTYAWDLNKNLTKITDAKGNIRNFTYDGLSRRTAAGDLHDPADTTYGTTTYAYDDAGNATSTTDAKAQTISRTFDALNRPLTENNSTSTGTTVIFLTANSGKGNQTWNVPSNWNSLSNTIECVGSGGDGAPGIANGGAGGAAGGGGAYAKITNLSLTPGGTATYAIGADATTTTETTTVGKARETYFNNTASSTASISCSWGRAANGSTGFRCRRPDSAVDRYYKKRGRSWRNICPTRRSYVWRWCRWPSRGGWSGRAKLNGWRRPRWRR